MNNKTMKRAISAAILAMSAQVAVASDYLTEVVSDVHPAEGMSANHILERGLQCIKSTGGNGATYIDPAIDGDTAYSVVKLAFTRAMIEDMIRYRVSVVAKDGRFKVASTDIERYSDFTHGYLGIAKVWGTGWQKVEEVVKDHSAKVASCITKTQDPIAAGDW